MGFFDELNRFLVENVSTGPVVSNESSYVDYYSNFTGDLSDDDDFIKEFQKAICEVARKRPQDTYVRQILSRSGGWVTRAELIGGEIPKRLNYGAWRLEFSSGEVINLRLRVPNGIQHTRDGKKIPTGYVVLPHYREMKQKEEEARNKRRARPALESFLGVKLGDPISDYCTNGATVIDMKNGLLGVAAKMNQFLNFDMYRVVKAVDGNVVIGVMCSMSPDKVADPKKQMAEVRDILIQKYKRDCVKDGDSFGMDFYRDEADPDEPYAAITLFADNAGGLCLFAFLTNETSRAMGSYEKDRARKRAEVIASNRAQALDAL